MLVGRAVRPLSLMLARGSLSTASSLKICSQQTHTTLQKTLRSFASSSWNNFASAPDTALPLNGRPIESNSQPAAVLHSAATLSQKQRKIISVVERALHTVLTRAVSPAHLSRYIAYISLSVLSISRDCYVVTIGWDCLDATLSSAHQQELQVCGIGAFFCSWHLTYAKLSQSFLIKMIPSFRNAITKVCSLHNTAAPPSTSVPICISVLSFFWCFSIDYMYHIDSELADREHACCACADYQVRLDCTLFFFVPTIPVCLLTFRLTDKMRKPAVKAVLKLF